MGGRGGGGGGGLVVFMEYREEGRDWLVEWTDERVGGEGE